MKFLILVLGLPLDFANRNSDKWLEQGGQAVSGSYATRSTVTFKKPFKDTNYSLCAMAKGNSHYSDQVMFYDKTTTSFGLAGSYNSNMVQNTTCNWIACGFTS